jgi:hypothetical protein
MRTQRIIAVLLSFDGVNHRRLMNSQPHKRVHQLLFGAARIIGLPPQKAASRSGAAISWDARLLSAATFSLERVSAHHLMFVIFELMRWALEREPLQKME